MFKTRWKFAAVAAMTTSALLASAGCKKEEPKKPVEAPAGLPDVELVAGDGVVGWVSLASYDAALNAADALASKLQLTAPGGSIKSLVTDNLTTILAVYGVTGTDWLDKKKPIHIGYQDEAVAPAAGAQAAPPNPALGTFIVLHVTDKAKTIAALAGAKKGAEAEGHVAMLDVDGTKIYFDFVGDKTLVLTPKDRFSKVKAFVERLDKITVPGDVYVGISLEDLIKTRGKEIDQVLTAVEQGNTPGLQAQAPGQAQLFATYAKKLRAFTTELSRFELILGADTELTKLEFRLTPKEGSKLQKQFAGTKGHTPGAIANLLPASSWLSLAANLDPASQIEGLDENLAMLRDVLHLDAAAYKAFLADVTKVAKLEDGSSAFALYQDGASPLGLLIGVGATDGPQVLTLTKKVISGIVSKLIVDQEAAAKAAGGADVPADQQLAIVKQAVADMKLEPVVVAYGPLLKEKGVVLTLGTAHDGDTTCDTLDIALDWAKISAGEEAATAKLMVGDKTTVSLCASKTKVVLGVGPGALEQSKRFAAGKVGGLGDAQAYKAATAAPSVAQSWGVLYANPGVAFSAFKASFPQLPTLPSDRAVVGACANRVKSWGCELDVPVALVAAAKTALATLALAAPAPDPLDAVPAGSPDAPTPDSLGAAPADAPDAPAPGPLGAAPAAAPAAK